MIPATVKKEVDRGVQGDIPIGITQEDGYNKNVNIIHSSQNIGAKVSFSEKQKRQIDACNHPRFGKVEKCPDEFRLGYSEFWFEEFLALKNGHQANTKLSTSFPVKMTAEQIKERNVTADKFRIPFEKWNLEKARFKWGDAEVPLVYDNTYYSRGVPTMRPFSAGDNAAGYTQSGLDRVQSTITYTGADYVKNEGKWDVMQGARPTKPI